MSLAESCASPITTPRNQHICTATLALPSALRTDAFDAHPGNPGNASGRAYEQLGVVTCGLDDDDLQGTLLSELREVGLKHTITRKTLV